MVIMPVSALFGFLSSINVWLGLFVSIIIWGYSLWLLYHGLVEALKCVASTARTVCYVLVAIVALFLIVAATGARKMSNIYNKDAMEFLKEMEKD